MALLNNNTKHNSKLTDANHTPKLRQKNAHHLTIAPEQHEGSPTPSTPRSVHSAKAPLKEKPLKEERRLLGSHQKIVVVPKAESAVRNPIKLTVGSTSSDSSDEKMTPPSRGPTHPLKKKAFVARSTSWKPGRVVGASPSLRSLKNAHYEIGHGNMRSNASWASFTFHEGPNSNFLRPMSDVISIRSLASIGMGSTDGKKLTIRRVPTSPNELLNIVEPNRLVDDDDFSSCSSFSGTLSESGTHYRPRREHWGNKLQFILACVGYCVGLGNIWRFPYFCYKSGGGAFLVPYFLILIICGIPLLYMELAIGQFTKRGPIGALAQLCPLFKGAGLSSVMVSFFISTYYNVIIAYCLYYFCTSFRSDTPWTECENRWNSKHCWEPSQFTSRNISRPDNSKTPAEEFYNRKVLQITSGIETFGLVRWELAACLFVAWIIVYFALWKSVRSSGRVLYFTATLPFVLVLAFLGRSLTLEGADAGLQYFFKPNWILLLDAKVWVNAAAQNFNSIGIAFGSVISFASYNRYGNQILVDAVAVSMINAVTSLIVGIFAFATIGNIAREHSKSVESVISDGPGLVFVLYPQAMAKMPFSNFWAILFFFMLLCLGLNSQFAIVEVVVTSIQDAFPNFIKRKLVCHEILVLVVCFVSFLLGLPNIMQGGIYFFQLMDHYIVSTSIVYIAFFEVLAIAWIYGTDRLSKVVQHMTGRYPSLYFRFCWLIAAPLLILCVVVFSIVDYEPPTYNNGTYKYPVWSQILGWSITAMILLCIPVVALYAIFKAEGNTICEKLLSTITPRVDDVSTANSIADIGNELQEVKTTLMDAKVPPNITVKGRDQRIEIMKR
uniref:Transporter n=2 Tax=Clastoptera arizonana TaxID=38151 RepID=A0A1B6CQI5_9HEMI